MANGQFSVYLRSKLFVLLVFGLTKVCRRCCASSWGKLSSSSFGCFSCFSCRCPPLILSIIFVFGEAFELSPDITRPVSNPPWDTAGGRLLPPPEVDGLNCPPKASLAMLMLLMRPAPRPRRCSLCLCDKPSEVIGRLRC